jgi:phosphatidylserine decarboxylase
MRDPDRTIPGGNSVVAAADGKITKIIRIGSNVIKIKKGLVGKIRTFTKDVPHAQFLVVIVMNLFNVHVQRAPVDGVVSSITYRRGTFRNAVLGDKLKHGFENEKNEILIRRNKANLKVIQVAGLLARRIECYVSGNQKLKKGQRIGRINLGSQVIMILPKQTKLEVSEGQKVKGGQTVIGRIK